MFTHLGKECKERLESYIQKSSPLEHKGKLSRLLSVNLYFFHFYKFILEIQWKALKPEEKGVVFPNPIL